MASNTETIQRGYEAFGRRDTDAALGILSDDIEWQGPDSERVPGSSALGRVVDAAGAIEDAAARELINEAGTWAALTTR